MTQPGRITRNPTLSLPYPLALQANRRKAKQSCSRQSKPQAKLNQAEQFSRASVQPRCHRVVAEQSKARKSKAEQAPSSLSREREHSKAKQTKQSSTGQGTAEQSSTTTQSKAMRSRSKIRAKRSTANQHSLATKVPTQSKK